MESIYNRFKICVVLESGTIKKYLLRMGGLELHGEVTNLNGRVIGYSYDHRHRTGALLQVVCGVCNLDEVGKEL